jgi:deoxyribodipyrimidine photolyase-related protein
MVEDSWHLAHSLLSLYMNLGMLSPAEVVEAAEGAWREGKAPLASVEGFIRQVIGWREYVWGVYWLFMPDYIDENALEAKRALSPMFRTGKTEMRCLAKAFESVDETAYAHHIQRLMLLGNFALLAGIEPRSLVRWMTANFIDGAQWVMIPNVVSMALYADGGRMTTKPYAAGGAYLDRMSTHCASCRFNPKKRTGDLACPFTTLYWDFLARNRQRLDGNHRLRPQLRGLDRLSDLAEVRIRATMLLEALDGGSL